MQLIIILLCSLYASSAGASHGGRNLREYFRVPQVFDLIVRLTGNSVDHVEPNKILDLARMDWAESIDLLTNFQEITKTNLKTAECSVTLDLSILQYMEILKESKIDIKTFDDFKLLADWKLEKCAREFDQKFSTTTGYMLEWSFDEFFKIVAKLDQKASDKALLEVAERFDVEHDVHSYGKVCQVANAFNQMRLENTNAWRRLVMSGFAKVGWYSRPQLGALLNHYMERVAPEECAMALKSFFFETCTADNYGTDTSVNFINLAVAFGVDPASIMSPRTQKFREYKRICYGVQSRLRPRRNLLGEMPDSATN